MFCRKCGKEIPADSDFCPDCGSEVAGVEGSGERVGVPQPPADAAQMPAATPRASTGAQMGATAPKPKRGKTPLVILGTLVLLAMIAAIVIVVIAVGGDGPPEHGIRITLETVDECGKEAMEKAVDVIRARLEGCGVGEFGVKRKGENGIVVEISGDQEVDRILSIIVSTAQLQFREVLEVLAPGDENYDTTEVTVPDPNDLEAYQALKDQEIVLTSEGFDSEELKVHMGPTRLTGDIIAAADAAVDEQTGGYRIVFELTGDASQQFGELTTELQGKQMAIVLDYHLESYPVIREPITEGNGEITGDFTREEAKDLALVMKIGALPVEFEASPKIERY